ncbi:Disease resistance protein [Actinidia chinensis var. chinensis]|uniref:Disease resistance protein n=1 Tax=Actinidia chinensis var. chinensis TaxID=1590841 RepID=A0A2R6Q1M8_ACTCC|nr:Disease resistance protein [Actinidia chinensis var. chinensis]
MEKEQEDKSSKGVAINIAAVAYASKHLENNKARLKRKKWAILCKTKRKTQEGQRLSPADKEFLEKMKGNCSDQHEIKLLEEILELAGVKVSEGRPLDPRETKKSIEMKEKAEELKCKAKVLKRRTDILHLLLSYPLKYEAEEESPSSLRQKLPSRKKIEALMLDKSELFGVSQHLRKFKSSKSDEDIFSSINQQIRKFEASILHEHYQTGSNESHVDIYWKVRELFLDAEEKLARYVPHIAGYLLQYVVVDKQDLPDADIERSVSRTEPDEQIMLPTCTKSQYTPSPYEDEMLRAPEEIRKLAINSAVRQILYYFEDRRLGKIGISGSCGEVVSQVLKDLQETRYMFDVVHCVPLLQAKSIIELQMNVAEMACRAPKKHIHHSTRLLLLVDCIGQEIDLNDLDFADSACVVLNTRSPKLTDIMAVDMEIRMEDHLLPWRLFCQNVGQVLDHSSNLQQKAVHLIGKCHGHLLAIILLARALKDVSDVSVWELALHELTRKPLSPVQGMSLVMINVLRFIWERIDSRAKNCIKYCLSHEKGKEINKALLINYGFRNGWIETLDEGKHILEELATLFLIEDVGKGSIRMQEETRLVLVNTFMVGKDPEYLKHGDLGLTEPPKAEEWGAKEINLMNNMLSELPESPNCPFLVKLFLQGNYDLMVIPSSFFECMPVLQVLDFSHTSIKSLPPSISRLVSLRELYLRGCDLLIKLPPEIGALKKLEVFDLEGTEIMYLPKEIGDLVSLIHLKLSFSGCANLCNENKDGNTVIPRMALSNLSQLNELSIDVHPEGDWWDVQVKAIINELRSLQNLRILKLYLPIVELLKDLRWDSTSLIYPALTHFRFLVGHHEQRFISRVPHKVEQEFDSLEKGLKYINGEGIPTNITKALKHANAFFLERHWTVKNLSEFGTENMDKLKFCLLAECNEFQWVVDGQQFYQGGGDSDFTDYEDDSDFDDEIILGSLQCLSIHYMKNMESICKGPVGRGCLSNLKSLALHTCPNLTTIFTIGMIGNLINLKELVVEDCPKITSIVTKISNLNSGHFLPNLKKMSLLELPELVSVSGGLSIAPKLVRLVVFYCPKLEKLSTKEVSSEDLKVIKGESEWWDSLKWHESMVSGDHQDYLASIFVPLKREGDLMAQLEKD